MVAERAAFANRTVADPVQPALEDATLDVMPAVPVRPVTAERDNLQRIGGVTPEIEQGLNAQGVSRYSQIAQWSPSDIERFEKQLLTGGRIARENWVEQAQILSRGGDTRFSRAFDYPQGAEPRSTGVGDAPREQPAARTDLGSLRSVRSRAYQGAPEPGPEAAQRAAAQNKVVRASSSNDLKRIRGIGVLIERKLNSMGVTTYDHIANWTADDVDRVSQSLDFKGRIERENWVEQARILSAGGQTEFSRRVDRGEVETSRAQDVSIGSDTRNAPGLLAAAGALDVRDHAAQQLQDVEARRVVYAAAGRLAPEIGEREVHAHIVGALDLVAQALLGRIPLALVGRIGTG